MKRPMFVAALLCAAVFVASLALAGDLDNLAYINGASHIDLEWKWTFAEAIDVCHRSFAAVLDIIDLGDDLDPNPVYYSQSQALAYAMMEELFPDVFARIAQRVADGHWEVVGGMWVESDANLPGGESFVRQLFYGKRYFQEKFGVNVDIGWLPDSFGYNGNLPQFFARAGIDKFFYYKTNWNDTHQPTIHYFWWQAPDGSRVLAHLSFGLYNNFMIAPHLRSCQNEAATLNPEQPGILYPIGMGDHGGGIGRFNIGEAITLAKNGWPMHFGPARDFFADIDTSDLPTIADELYFEKHRGAYTSRAKHKEEVRALEYGFMGAESAATLANLPGLDYPADDFFAAWQALMLDEFHDTMAGTCLEKVYAEDVARRNAAAFDFIDEAATDAVASLAGVTATSEFSGPGWFIVYNPLGFALTAPVLVAVPADQTSALAIRDDAGNAVACQVDVDGGGLWMIAAAVPAYGWRAYEIVPGEPGGAAPYDATDTALENARLRLALDPQSGLLVSLVDKSLDDREFIQAGQGGNLLQIYHDNPRQYDAWDLGFNKYTDAPIEELTAADSVTLVETGPVRSVIRVTRTGEVESYVQDTIVYYDLPRADFTTRIFGWGAEAHRFLKVAFPLDLVNEKLAETSEIPYGTITRTLDGHWAYTEFSGHKWTDISQTRTGSPDVGPGVALVSREKFGYDVANDGGGAGLSDGKCHLLRLSLLKSGTSPLYRIPNRGGPITDRGDFLTHYALYPHAGDALDANLLKVGNEYYAPIIVRFTGGEPEPRPTFIEASPANALVMWLKKPEVDPQPDRVLLRVVESQGRDATAVLRFPGRAVTDAMLVDLLEEPTDQEVRLTDENTVEFDLGAHEILSLVVALAPAGDDDDDDTAADDDDDDVSGDDDEDDFVGGCGC